MIAIGITVLALLGIACAYFVFVYDNGFAGFDYEPASPRPPEQRAEGSLTTVRFPAKDGTEIEGWLFEPLRPSSPLVIMAPGLTGTKEGHLEPFAWRFVRKGFAVLLIDFRCLGGSGGFPRHWVGPFRQAEDYESALYYAATTLAERGIVDPERIAFWGSSFSGGSAIFAAAKRREVAAVIAQCPFLKTPPRLQPRGLALARYTAWTMLDLTRAFLRERTGLALPPVYVPAFGQPDEFAFATSRENPSRFDPANTGSAFFRSLPSPLRGSWENKLLVRFLADFDRFVPIDHVEALGCPLYLVAAAGDDMIPQPYVEEAFALARHEGRRLDTHDCGHFDLYLNPVLDENAARQADFLTQALGAGSSERAIGGDDERSIAPTLAVG